MAEILPNLVKYINMPIQEAKWIQIGSIQRIPCQDISWSNYRKLKKKKKKTWKQWKGDNAIFIREK